MIRKISELLIEKENKLSELSITDMEKYRSDFNRITLEYKIKIQKVLDNNPDADADI
jgi:hypothetical protein